MKNVIMFFAILTVILFLGCTQPENDQNGTTNLTEQSCIDSGGTVTTAMCCESTDDFPDDCAIGACGCAPEYSHEVKLCNCGEESCFNGEKCALIVNSFEECVNANYPVMESYPRQCKGPDGRTFTEEMISQ